MSCFTSRTAIMLAVVITLGVMAAATASWAGDPTGTNTGTVADITAAKAGAPTPAEVQADLGHLTCLLGDLPDDRPRGALAFVEAATGEPPEPGDCGA